MDQIYVGAGLAIFAYLIWFIAKEVQRRKK